MTDADKLKLSDEIAKAAIKQHTVGTVFVDGVPITLSKTVEGEDGYFAGPPKENQLLSSNPAHALWSYRKRLQAERDAKDAPRLREERDKFKAALEEIGGHKFWDGPYFQRVAREAIKEAP